MVVGCKVGHIEVVVVRMAVVLVVGPIDLAVAVAAVHMKVTWAVDHMGLVVGLGGETEDTEKTSGLVVVGVVCCTLIDLEDMVMMFRRELNLEVEDRATEVALEIQDVAAWAVRPVDLDMEWQPGPGKVDSPDLWPPSYSKEAFVAVKEVWLHKLRSSWCDGIQAVKWFIGSRMLGGDKEKGLRMPGGRWRRLWGR
jgi:hypothetical protein